MSPIVLTPQVLEPSPVPGLVGIAHPLTEYRHRIAEETANFLLSQVSTASTTFLQDLRYPIKSSLDQSDLYAGKWLLRPNTTDERDRVRIVGERGYDPGTGVLRPDSAWFTVPVTGEPYELHAVVEPWDQMLDLVNEALKRCFLVDHLVLAVGPDERSVNLTPYAPWLQDRRWVRGAAFVDPAQYDDPAQIDMSESTLRGFVDQQGLGLYLRWQHAWTPGGGTLVVRCIRRAYDYCRATPDGVFGEQSGLGAESHEAVPDPEWVTAAAMTDFWDEFGNVVAAGNREESEVNQKKWAQRFTTLTEGHFQLPDNTLLAPVKRGWGPGAY